MAPKEPSEWEIAKLLLEKDHLDGVPTDEMRRIPNVVPSHRDHLQKGQVGRMRNLKGTGWQDEK